MGKISTSTWNFSRLFLLILNPGTRTLQSLFEKQYSSTGDDLESFLKSKERKVKRLHKKDIITKDQMEHLFPSNGDQPSVQKLDISLLCTLLTNLCTVTKPVLGWSVTPTVTDRSTGADISRLKTSRNKLAHRVNSNVSDDDFNHAWTDISECIMRLSNQLDQLERDEIHSQISRIKNESIENSNGMQLCNIETLFCEIDAKLQALLPDEAEMIVVISDDEEEEEDAMNAVIPKGEDGKNYLQKRYSYIKDELTKEDGKYISKHLLKNGLISRDVCDRLTNVWSSRSSLIDSLLKIVLLGKDEMLENFFEVLKVKNPELANCLANTEVTSEDRIRLQNLAARDDGNQSSTAKLHISCGIDESDIIFFQKHLCDFPETVEKINDAMLSRLHFSAGEHSIIVNNPSKVDRISNLLKTMQSCNLDAEAELQTVLDDHLFDKWTKTRSKMMIKDHVAPEVSREGNHVKEEPSKQTKQGIVDQGHLNTAPETLPSVQVPNYSADNQEGNDQDKPGRWENRFHSLIEWIPHAPLVNSILEMIPTCFIGAEKGSIILKFLVEGDFKVDSLDPESIKKNILQLLQKGSVETNIQLEGLVNITIFILSPNSEGQEEIHLHLDLHANAEKRKSNEYCYDSKNNETIKLIIEEMDPEQLKVWMLGCQYFSVQTQSTLDKRASWKKMSRREKMKVLLDIIIKDEDGFNAFGKFCKKNDPYVYNRAFLQSRQPLSCTSHLTAQIGKITYEKGGGCQKLCSMWLEFCQALDVNCIVPDDIIRLTKQFCDIKDELSKEKGSAIAERLLKAKLISMDDYQRIIDSKLSRSLRIDMLLEAVILGKPESFACFFEGLKMVAPQLAIDIENTKISDDDRTKLSSLAKPPGRDSSFSEQKLSRCSTKSYADAFFQYHLHDSEDVIQRINDLLLSRLAIRIEDHSRIRDCPSTMAETLRKYDQIHKLELHDALGHSLFRNWTMHKNVWSKEGKEPPLGSLYQSQSRILETFRALYEWIQAVPSYVVEYYFKEHGCHFLGVVDGVLVLKFIADFNAKPLHYKSLKQSMAAFLGRFCLETDTTNIALSLTVFRYLHHITGQREMHLLLEELKEEKDPSGIKGQREMHLLLEELKEVKDPFGINGQRVMHLLLEELKVEKDPFGINEEQECDDLDAMKIMKEEMDPDPLKHEMFDRPLLRRVDAQTLKHLDEILLRKDLSRKTKMDILLKNIRQHKLGLEMLSRYCAVSDKYVYKEVFIKHEEVSLWGKLRKSGKVSALALSKEEKMEKVFSEKIYINKSLLDLFDENISREHFKKKGIGRVCKFWDKLPAPQIMDKTTVMQDSSASKVVVEHMDAMTIRERQTGYLETKEAEKELEKRFAPQIMDKTTVMQDSAASKVVEHMDAMTIRESQTGYLETKETEEELENKLGSMYDQDVLIRLLKRYADIKSELSKEQGTAISKYLLERGFINKDDYNIVTDSWCSRRSRIESLLKMTITRGSEILSCFMDSLKSVCPTIMSYIEQTKITDKDRKDMKRLKEFSSGKMNANINSCVSDKIEDIDITFFQNRLCDSQQALDDMSDALLSRLAISVEDHTNIIKCLLIHEKIFTIFNTLRTYSNLDLESELGAVLEKDIYHEYHNRRYKDEVDWLQTYSSPISTRLTKLLRWVDLNTFYVRAYLRGTSLRFLKVQGRTWQFARLPNSSEVPFEPRRLKQAMAQIIQRGCHETGIGLECPLYMSVFILTPGDYKCDEDIIHMYFEMEEGNVLITKDDQLCDYECLAMQILREEMDPDQLLNHIYVMSRIAFSHDQTCEHNDPEMERLKELNLDELQQQLFDRSCPGKVDEIEKIKSQGTVVTNGLTRQERMGILLQRICQHKCWLTLLEKFCKEHDYFLYNKLFHEHQRSQLWKLLRSYRNTDDIWGEKDFLKGGGLQMLFMMRLDGFVMDKVHLESVEFE